MKKLHLLPGILLSTHALAQSPPAPDTLPEGGRIVAGEADISQTDSTLSIHQSSERAAIDWESFDVGSRAKVEFLQPSGSSVALNRVTGNNASQIFGRITANGQVFLSNPNGVYFAPGASVNVGGLVATTHRISVEDFMAGRMKFERNGATGSVINEGELSAALAGYIALLAPTVRNQGVILANLGTVAMAAGETFELQFGSNNTLANLRVTPSAIQSLVENHSAVLAPGGLIILSAQAVDRIQGGVIRNSGVLEATGLAQRSGRIVLEASNSIANTGRIDASATADGPAGSVSLRAAEILNSGLIAASGSDEYADAGSIEIAVGNYVQEPTGLIDVSAPALGGALTIEASGEVALAGGIDATATSDDGTTRGGVVTINAAQIGLSSATIDTSGSLGGQITLNAAAAADHAPPAPLPAPERGELALIGNTQLSSRGRRGRGGSISLLGDDIGLLGNTTLLLTGTSGGGKALIGGGWQGSGGLHQATTVTMDADVRIDVSATERGDGGTAVLWSDVHAARGSTHVQGSVFARGGASGGNGGSIETSGHSVDIAGLRVAAEALAGKGGQWLIDPFNYTIDAPAATAITGALNASTSVLVTTTVSNTSFGGSSNGGDNGVITVSSPIAKTGGSDATLTLQSHRRINVNAPISSTSGKLNVVLWSDYANTNLSGVAIANSISTNGGHVWVGGSSTTGGSQTWNGLTVGDGPSIGSATDNANGMDLGGSITTSGGDVLLWAGAGNSAGNDGIGVDGSRTINAGSGNVSLITNKVFNWQNSGNLTVNTTGTLTLAPAQSSSYGATFDWTGTNTAGNFRLNNTLSANTLTINSVSSLGGLSIGRYSGMSGVSMTSTSDLTISNAIGIAGPVGLYGGNITVNTTLNANGSVAIDGSAVNINAALSASGDISVISSGTNADLLINVPITNNAAGTSSLLLKSARHVSLGGSATFTASQATNTQIWADSDRSGDGIVRVQASSIDTHGGTLRFGNNETASINGVTTLVGGDVFFNGSGAQTITTGGGEFDLYGESILANTAGLTISTGGGNVNFHGVLNSGNTYSFVDKTGSAGSGSWTQARTEARNGTSGGSTVGDSYLVTITSRLENSLAGLAASYRGAWIGAYRADPATSYAWSWADGPEGGQPFLTQASSGGGGTVTSGRFNNFGTGEPNGGLAGNSEFVAQLFGTAGQWNDLTPSTTYQATQANQYAVLGYVRETNLGNSPLTINAGSGLVTIGGAVGGNKALSSLTVNAASIALNGNALVTSGAQTYNNALTVTSSGNLNVAASAITLTGPGEELLFQAAGDITLSAPSVMTHEGAISMDGGNLTLAADLTTQGGNILLRASGASGIATSGTQRALSSGSGDITLTADTVAGPGLAIASTGQFTFQPYGNAWSNVGSTLNVDGTLNADTFTGGGDVGWLAINSVSGLTGFTIGKPGNTSSIQFDTAWTIDGPINFYGNNITLNAELSAIGDNTITLLGSGNITDGASGFVSASKLLLLGGNVTLDSASNGVGTLAASGISGLTFIDADTLVLGTVGSTHGVSATGIVNIGTLTGHLTLLEDVVTTNTGNAALTLNAGIVEAAGSAADANIFVFNDSTVGVGAGGRARLFSGSVADSGGLTSLIGSGSGRFRYNSDESSTNYALALGTGLHAIYREQPTVTRTIDNQSTVYDSAAPAWTFTVDGGLNGDTYAQAFATAPTVSAGGAVSTSNNPIVGDHALTGTGGSATSQLGYAVNPSIVSGTLTVAPRTLTVNYTAGNKIYDGNATAAVSDSDDRITNDVLTISETTAFADPNAGVAKTVDISGIGLSGTDAANYTVATTASTTADITPRTVTLSGNHVYDGTTTLGAADVTFGNLVGPETLGFSGAIANDAHVASNGKYVNGITLLDGTNGGLAGNYQLPTLNVANAPVTIIPRAIGSSAAIGGTLNKTYDGTTAANGAGVSGSVTGAVNGDVVSLDTSAISFAYDSAHVASATSIAANGAAGFSIDSSTYGSQESDYSFTAPTIAPVAASIAPATLTPNLTNNGLTKAYDGTANAPAGFTATWSFTGLIGGDTAATFTSSGAAYNSKDVAAANSVTVSGLAIGSITGSNGSLSTDYALDATSKSVAASITPRAVTVTGLAANDKTYDGTNTAVVSNWGSVNTGIGSETLALNASEAAFSDANAGTGKTIAATGYALSNGSNGGLASNYALTSSTATTTANINKALLTVIANHDAKFVTRPDASGYSGLSYHGFVHGENAGVLTGSATVFRSNSGNDAAGAYAEVLTPDISGLSSMNYSFVLQNGDYTIAPSNQLLVRVANSTTGYGTQLGYTISSAEYLDTDTNNVVSLTSISDEGNGRFTVSDGAGGSASFTVSLENASLSGAGFARAGAYQLNATGVSTLNAQNFNNQLTLIGSRSVTQRGIGATAVNGIAKVYDGTIAMVGVQISLTGAESADAVTASGAGAFSNRNAGTNIAYTVNDLTLGGDDASNYFLTGGTSFSGTDGTITPRTLLVSYGGVNKVYDGNTNASITTSDNRIGGDALTIDALAAFTDKNVGTGKLVTIGDVALTGADAGNYLVSASGSTTADVTRLDSVTWMGGASGNWFDPANWAGGAVPDLSNVAKVILPAGVEVTFDTTGAVAPAQTGPVHLDSLGTVGSLTQNNGELAIGAGGVQLDGFTQNGGALGSDGDIALKRFTQTGGRAATEGDFTVDSHFSQGNSGLVSIGGNANITDVLGGATVGNLTTGGHLHVTSTAGDVVQVNGSTIAVGGNTAVDAGTFDIELNGVSNDFIGAFNATGHNIDVADGYGGLILGNVNAAGAFGAISTNGDLTQTVSSAINVSGHTTLQAPGNSVTLNPSGNHFSGGLSVVDAIPTAATPPVPPPAAPAFPLPSPRTAPALDNIGLTNVSVVLVTASSDQTDGLVTVDVPPEMTSTGFAFALPKEALKELPADTRITATREDGARLPTWLTFDAHRRRFIAAQIPEDALPLRVAVAAGGHRLTIVIAVAEGS